MFIRDSLVVNAVRIGITVNGVERSVNISDNETIQSFIDKLKEIGVDASFNSTTGVFTVNLDTADINDYDNTGIVNALHLIGVNEGYTSDKLQIEKDVYKRQIFITAGNLMVNSVKFPSSLSTDSSPLCDLIICNARYRPSPVPIFLNFLAAE